MSMIMKNVQKVEVSAQAQTIDVKYRNFMLSNNSDSTVYFKELEEDGIAVTVDTGFALPPKTMTQYSLNASKLSVIGSGNADLRVLFVEED